MSRITVRGICICVVLSTRSDATVTGMAPAPPISAKKVAADGDVKSAWPHGLAVM